jgi:hypothetical protein
LLHVTPPFALASRAPREWPLASTALPRALT